MFFSLFEVTSPSFSRVESGHDFVGDDHASRCDRGTAVDRAARSRADR
jgi:hypothetical protein